MIFWLLNIKSSLKLCVKLNKKLNNVYQNLSTENNWNLILKKIFVFTYYFHTFMEIIFEIDKKVLWNNK